MCHPALGVAVLVPGLAVDDEADDLNAYAPAGGDTCIYARLPVTPFVMSAGGLPCFLVGGVTHGEGGEGV